MVKKISTKAELDSEFAGNAGKLVVMDFYADWCGPCRMIAPKVEAMAAQNTDVLFIKVNVDDSEELSKLYEVKCMPTFVFVKDGKKVDSLSGADEKALAERVQKYK